jgi:hypothetical protein
MAARLSALRAGRTLPPGYKVILVIVDVVMITSIVAVYISCGCPFMFIKE